MIYLQLFYEFMKTGFFAIGGGFATLPFLYAMADKYPWFNRELLSAMIGISESTPGPIGINMATYAGYAAAGAGGGIIASFALVIPSVFIVSLVAKFLSNFNENRFTLAAFYGLRPVVAALIASAGMGMAGITTANILRLPEFFQLINIRLVIIFAVLFIFTRIYKKAQPYQLILAGAAAGIILKM